MKPTLVNIVASVSKKLLGATASESLPCKCFVVCNSGYVYPDYQDLPDCLHCYGRGDVETTTPTILLTVTRVYIFMHASVRECMCIFNSNVSCQSDVKEGIL